MRFSEHFGIQLPQEQLEFVDIPLETDIQLFVDPYALALGTDAFSVEATHLTMTFFHRVVGLLRSPQPHDALSLLQVLMEPNEVHLGFSTSEPQGRGVGDVQAQQLYDRLVTSQAVQTGFLQDLADCELVIPGIGSDKISDITVNTIRAALISFTQGQCELHSVPTSPVSAGAVWHANGHHWCQNEVHELPSYCGQRVLLVPKHIVRRKMALDYGDYYQQYVLTFLQEHYLSAGERLVTLLRSGERRVYKKHVSQVHPNSKGYLYDFSLQHPEVLSRYKRDAAAEDHPLSDAAIEELQPA
jgi:hypothetical protein